MATVIGQIVTAILAVWYLLHMKIIKPAKGDYALNGPICGKTLTLGITSFLSQISLVAAINNMLRKYGAADAVFGQEQFAHIPMAVVGIVKEYGERSESPQQRPRDKDKRRAAYHRFYTDMKWGHTQNYHISLDSGALGIDRCADILRQLYEKADSGQDPNI